jgi:hypothetical protein
MGRRGTAMKKRGRTARAVERFPVLDRFTVSGSRVGDFCFACECRVVAIGGEEGVALAWCDCVFPEDHHEMEVL